MAQRPPISDPDERFRPAFPPPRWKLPNPAATLYYLYANPVALLTHDHYSEPIIANRMFGKRAVFLGDPDYIRHVFSSNRNRYGLDPIRKLLLKGNFERGMATVEGEEWKQARKTGAAFLDAGHLCNYATEIEEVVAQICNDQPDRQRCDLVRLVAQITFACSMRCLYSLSDDGSFNSIIRSNERYMSNALRVDFMDIMRMPHGLPRFLKRSTRRNARKLRADTDRLYQQRASQIENGCDAPDDLLSRYCSHARSGMLPEKERSGVLDNIGTMMGAAYETTSNALCWTLYFLSKSPSAMRAVRQEAIASGHTLPPQEWPATFPVCLAAMRETLRLYPPLPGIVRYALDNDIIAGFPIRKGDFVIGNVWALQRTDRYWSNGNLFDISRFLPGGQGLDNNRYYMPFGVGPRMCVGRQFSELVAVITLVSILRQFELSFVGTKTPEPVWRGTLRPNGPIHFEITRRKCQTGTA
ncbi:cytochrome P450 [Hoeflea sp. TYP-13]|uniref:cytochrome P450 n=1 Tax=Hoeflea sp. TYP-13 TaxID=3230023 RepID=UPI0034C64D99